MSKERWPVFHFFCESSRGNAIDQCLLFDIHTRFAAERRVHSVRGKREAGERRRSGPRRQVPHLVSGRRYMEALRCQLNFSAGNDGKSTCQRTSSAAWCLRTTRAQEREAAIPNLWNILQVKVRKKIGKREFSNTYPMCSYNLKNVFIISIKESGVYLLNSTSDSGTSVSINELGDSSTCLMKKKR